MMDGDLLTQHLRELPYFRAMLRAVEARIMGRQELPAPTLDVGSGDGHFAQVTYDRLIDVGLDPESATMREAQRRGAYRMLTLADGALMPFPDRTFASALSNSVLEHILGVEAVLNELGRVLQPGAPFVFTVPNPGYRDELSIALLLRKVGLDRLGDAYREWFMRMSRTWNVFDEEGWRARLDEAGFDLRESTRYFSPQALRALEWGHYFGGPTLLSRWLTGRWVLAPTAWNLGLTDRVVRRYFEEATDENGTYTFFRAVRR